MRRLVSLIALTILAASAGCTAPRSESPAKTVLPEDPAVEAAFKAIGPELAAGWRKEQEYRPNWRDDFIPLQPLLRPPPKGYTDPIAKSAATYGSFRLAAKLSTAPVQGRIEYAGGAKTGLPFYSASDAYKQMAHGQARAADSSCLAYKPDSVGTLRGKCVYLTVVGATFTTARMWSNLGWATVPVWSFAVRELGQPVAYVAVIRDFVKGLPLLAPPSTHPPHELDPAKDYAPTDGRQLTFRLGVGACRGPVRPLVWESDEVIVVGGAEQQVVYSGSGAGDCAAILEFLPVSVTLDKPVGTRIILDAVYGKAIEPSGLYDPTMSAGRLWRSWP